MFSLWFVNFELFGTPYQCVQHWKRLPFEDESLSIAFGYKSFILKKKKNDEKTSSLKKVTLPKQSVIFLGRISFLFSSSSARTNSLTVFYIFLCTMFFMEQRWLERQMQWEKKSVVHSWDKREKTWADFITAMRIWINFQRCQCFLFFRKVRQTWLQKSDMHSINSISVCVCVCVENPLKHGVFFFFLQKIRERIMYSSFSNVNIQLSFSFQ